MGEHPGAIISIASVSGIRGDPHDRRVQREQAADQVAGASSARGDPGQRHRAGNCRTEALVLLETPQIRDFILAATALRRVGEPDEIPLAPPSSWRRTRQLHHRVGALVADGGNL